MGDVLGVATTTIAVLRGTGTSAWADEVDADTVVASGIPAALSEQRERNSNRADGVVRTVRFYTCRVTGRADVRKDDRVRDENTAEVFAVDSVRQQRSPVNTPDLILQLRQVTN